MGNPVNKFTPVMAGVKVVNEKLEFHGQAGYVVEPAKADDDKVGVKMDADSETYEFAQSDLETLS